MFRQVAPAASPTITLSLSEVSKTYVLYVLVILDGIWMWYPPLVMSRLAAGCAVLNWLWPSTKWK